MPAISEWFPRLPEIIGDFEALSTMILDREIFVRVFKVSRRQAIRLMHEFDARQTDRGLAANRLEVLSRLREMQDDFDIEERRRARLTADLEAARRLAPARKIRIETAPDVRDRLIADLPAGIRLRPGELRIEFVGAEDLLRLLFELSQAAGNDYARFVSRCEEPAAKSGAAGARSAA